MKGRRYSTCKYRLIEFTLLKFQMLDPVEFGVEFADCRESTETFFVLLADQVDGYLWKKKTFTDRKSVV